MYAPAWPPGVTVRHFGGPADFATVADVYTRATGPGADESIPTGAEIENDFTHTPNFDVESGLLIVHADDRPIGYVLGRWNRELSGTYIYRHMGKLVPEYRRRGIGTAMVAWAQRYLGSIAATHDATDQQFQTDIPDSDVGAVRLVTNDGYRTVGHTATMIRSHLDGIPDRPLPDGVEIRPVRPEHMRAIWEADAEAFRDHAGAIEPDETDWERFRGDPGSDPSLWKVAWHGSAVIGQVRTFIDQAANEAYGLRRGYTEDISTVRAWRGKGVAGALICESLRHLKSLGLAEAGLGVHVENPNGAYRLYEGLGYEVTTSGATYQRPLTPGETTG